MVKKKGIRVFATGATRDLDQGKRDYEGFLSPLVIESFGNYMHRNRYQKDGSIRNSDNWQLGIPLDAYVKSAWRHFLDWWKLHRQGNANPEKMEEALCAMFFNVQGYLHEHLKGRKKSEK